MKDKPDYIGHRQRLKQKFKEAGPKALNDYKILELLLFFAVARRDTKPIAKAMLKRFSDLSRILNAEPKLLKEINGVGEAIINILHVVREINNRQLHKKIKSKSIFKSLKEVIDYCNSHMTHSKRELLRILFLNQKNQLIIDEIHAMGTIDQVTLYPREIVTRALEVGAKSLIIVHNHPCGDPTPSQADITITKQLSNICQTLGLILHDHLIIGNNNHVSLKDLGYI